MRGTLKQVIDAPRRAGRLVGRLVRPVRKPVGGPPGVPVYTGEVAPAHLRVRCIEYGTDGVNEREWDLDALPDPPAPPDRVTWIDVTGLADIEALTRLGERLALHPLLLEDVVNAGQRAKVEEYEGALLVVMKDVRFDARTRAFGVSQVSVVLGPGYVATFREHPEDDFEPVRERIRTGRGRIRRRGADYLAYALIDCVVDRYFEQLEVIGDEIDELEELVTSRPDSGVLERLHSLRREMLVFRKVVWPLREACASLCRDDYTLIDESTIVYLRDVYDHVVQVFELVETLRDVLSSLMDLYLSTLSNWMNETMRVLTIIATIFIPITFIAGVYGMNFEHMPELRLRWAYPAVLGVMALVVAGMLWYFRRRKFLP